LTAKETILAFIDGIRFDLSIFFTFSGIFLLMLLIPIKKKLYYKVNMLFILIFYNAYIIILSGDLIFFEDVKRHISDEIILMGNDLSFFVHFIEGNYLIYLAILTMLLCNILLWKKIRHYINDKIFPNVNIFSKKDMAAIFLFLIIAVFGIRGTPTGKSINLVDAFTMGSSQYGNLVLNGVFTSYHTIRARKLKRTNYFPKKKAEATATKLIIEDYEQVNNTEYPLDRHIKKEAAKKKQKYNIAILLLESWSAKFIDGISHNGYGATPNVDKRIKDSLVFDNFYANGQRSIYGITSTLLSIPYVKGLPFLGQGLEVSNIIRIGNMFNQRDYSTIAMQSSNRRSFRVSSIAKAIGFKEFYGREDIPVIYPYTPGQWPHFGWDYDTLQFLFHKLDKASKPFFSFVFTGTTHENFTLPAKEFEKFKPHGEHSLNGFLNTLYYADYSIGAFLKKAEKTPWFKNTIFILLADHCLGKFQSNSIKEKFNIPLIVYAPYIIKPGINHSLGSQVDIVPTILDITGANSHYSGIGKSLFRKSDKRFAILNQGNIYHYKTASGYISCSENKIIDTNIKSSIKQQKMLNNFLSVDQTLFDLIKENKFSHD